MKTTFLKLAPVLLLLLAAFPLRAQNFTLDWFTVDGGGGTSAGGAYSVSGTLGQPDAGAMTGGNFAIAGGFWSVEGVNLPGVPTLFIARSGANTIISWTPGTPGFVLQGNGGLSTAGWADAPSGSTNPASISVAEAARFYRLRKP